MTPLDQIRELEFPKICDPRGNLSFIEGGCHVPFSVKRVFYVYDVPGGATRGAHAHRSCTEVIIPLAGAFDVHLSDGVTTRVYRMNSASRGLLVPPGLWLSIHNYTTGALQLVLCSDLYEEEDYIRDYDEFLQYAASAHCPNGSFASDTDSAGMIS